MADDFMSYMNSISVHSEEETQQEEEATSGSLNQTTDTEMKKAVEEQQQQPLATARVRRSFGESMMGRFKGFFENDDAVN
jgi:hypothetical protein